MNNLDPKLPRKIVNFAVALGKHTADGFDHLDQQTYEARIAICQGTSTRPSCTIYDRKKKVCRDFRCGCSILKKARWRSEKCPHGKWEEEVRLP